MTRKNFFKTLFGVLMLPFVPKIKDKIFYHPEKGIVEGGYTPTLYPRNTPIQDRKLDLDFDLYNPPPWPPKGKEFWKNEFDKRREEIDELVKKQAKLDKATPVKPRT